MGRDGAGQVRIEQDGMGRGGTGTNRMGRDGTGRGGAGRNITLFHPTHNKKRFNNEYMQQLFG